MGYQYPADRLIKIAISLSTEKDIDILLEKILKEAMEITRCDGGTVYIKGKETLRFNNMITLSKGIELRGEDKIGIPDVPLTKNHVCALSAMEHRSINIPDVYESEEFDFSGAKNYDRLNGYCTRSMLVIPMEDEQDEVIGVLQLINAMDNAGNPVSFEKEHEEIIAALASIAAVSLNNTILAQTVLDTLHSFVRVMVGAVDIESTFNANHTKSMVKYAEAFLSWLDEEAEERYRIPEKEKDPFLMSIWLHDIGKLLVPMDIMNKASRLGNMIKDVRFRASVARLTMKLMAAEGRVAKEDADEKVRKITEAMELIEQSNRIGYLEDEVVDKLKEIASMRIPDEEGDMIEFLTPKEIESITVQKGTLTDEERTIMEYHVLYTSKLLDEMRFRGIYENVPIWAGAHHELLDGTGYPEGKKDKDIPYQVRILTIIDIYDALTAEDRPYKAPLSPDEAFEILFKMAEDGKIDEEVLKLFKDSRAWMRE